MDEGWYNHNKSYHGEYFDHITGKPLNIVGRTGLEGRGDLGLFIKCVLRHELKLKLKFKLIGVQIMLLVQFLQGNNLALLC